MWFLSSVNSHVYFKLFILIKTLSTLWAFVRLLPSMNFHVPIENTFLSETYSTLLAGERVFSRVNSHVDFNPKGTAVSPAIPTRFF